MEDMWDIPSNNSKFCRKMKRKVINDQKKKKDQIIISRFNTSLKIFQIDLNRKILYT